MAKNSLLSMMGNIPYDNGIGDIFIPEEYGLLQYDNHTSKKRGIGFRRALFTFLVGCMLSCPVPEPDKSKDKKDDNKTEQSAPDPYLPNVDLSGVDGEIIEGRTKVITLPEPTDSDTPGDIPYISAESLDGKVSPSLNGDQLTIIADTTTEETPYKIKLTFGSAQGGINTATLESRVLNLCNISGRLEKIGYNGVLQKGSVRLINPVTKEVIGLDNNGKDFILNGDNPSSTVRVEGELKDNNGENISWGRAIMLDGTKDHSGVIIRCTPYDGWDKTRRDNFELYVKDINITDSHGLIKYDIWHTGIVVTNPITGDILNSQDIDIITQVVGELNNDVSQVGGKISDIVINPTPGVAYDPNTLAPKRGWRIIYKDIKNLPANVAGVSDMYECEIPGTVGSARVRFNDCYPNLPIGRHEIRGHTGGLLRDSSDPPYAPTIMVQSGLPDNLTDEDKKLIRIVHENTNNPNETKSNLLAKNW